ncbi:DUF3794 and LysM peptidoglycan-binding domain-containing protein [Clostridium cellulovorans]|uniref:Peptidoglycan-binding lysin domain n=1 Tax=Clostridium cellulovorans (strain ATCC 35296 / DSM 3052 / OCM 3 / 743B) TaxID=573061 RepID=D9STQ2_CLOC7|nr:SPOCS domain-containing protein [Clostridium cellulovorans]ADL52786.1 Peptidoglycan-binding lysin domain [Clostridium cellulovorans 743B]
MGVELVKDTIEFEKLLGENVVNLIQKEEYIVPDSHPDVKNIISVDVKPVITTEEIVQDKVYVEGVIQYSILYIADESEERTEAFNLVYKSKFNGYVDMPGCEHDMKAVVNCFVEHMECRILNERKICLEGVLTVNALVKAIHAFDYVKGLSDTKNTQMLYYPLTVDKKIGAGDCNLIAKTQILVPIEKPQIANVVKNNVNFHKKSIKVMDGKVIIEGSANIKFLYKGKDTREFVAVEEEAMVSGEIPIDGATSDMLALSDVSIESIEYNVSDDDLGESRVIDVEVLFKGTVEIIGKDDIDIIDDAYCPDVRLNLMKKPYDLNIIFDHKYLENIVKDNIEIPGNMPKPINCLMTTGDISVVEKKIIDDKVLIEGLVKASVIYETNNENIYLASLDEELPFSCSIDIPGSRVGMDVIANLNLESIEGSIEANTIAIKSVVGADVTVKYNAHKEFIDDVSVIEGEVPKKKASVTIYTIQNGDTLWKVAKKYFTTVERLSEINDLEVNDSIKPGEKLIIEGRAII